MKTSNHSLLRKALIVLSKLAYNTHLLHGIAIVAFEKIASVVCENSRFDNDDAVECSIDCFHYLLTDWTVNIRTSVVVTKV